MTYSINRYRDVVACECDHCLLRRAFVRRLLDEPAGGPLVRHSGLPFQLIHARIDLSTPLIWDRPLRINFCALPVGNEA
jgi:hypothetical protein